MAIVTKTSCDTRKLLKLPAGYAHADTFVPHPLGEEFDKEHHAGRSIWTDGTTLYHSNEWDNSNFVWNPETQLWEPFTFGGWDGQYSHYIWTDGENIYYSDSHVFNKATRSWEPKSWMFAVEGVYLEKDNIWTDGDSIYYSQGNTQLVLNKATSTWEVKDWGNYYPYRGYIWSDGENVYWNETHSSFVLDKASSTWKSKNWKGLGETSLYGAGVWTDDQNIYYSYNGKHFVLDKATSTWKPKVWYGISDFSPSDLHSDGANIYYIGYDSDYNPFGLVLLPANTKLTSKVNGNWVNLDRFIVPTGTTEVTENGVYDVTANISVKVNVPMPGQYIVDTLSDLPANAIVGSIAIVIGGN